jgi:hypothetical protein
MVIALKQLLQGRYPGVKSLFLQFPHIPLGLERLVHLLESIGLAIHNHL